MVPRRYGLISMTFFTVPEAEDSVSVSYKLSGVRGGKTASMVPTDIAPCGSSRIDGYDDTPFEPECQGCRSVRELDSTFGVGGEGVGVRGEEVCWLRLSQRSSLRTPELLLPRKD